jgi:RNA polymerase sigma-70 factor (ECF subfamily)
VSQDDLYDQASLAHSAALERLARAYEANPEKRRDLLQEIHLELWKSFEGFDGRCSMRTWVYRIANNTAASYVLRERRIRLRELVGLDDIEKDSGESFRGSDDRLDLDRLLALVHRLRPLDRQIMLLYLEDMDSASIGEIIGISAGNVRTQIHRIKAILARRFHGGGQDER